METAETAETVYTATEPKTIPPAVFKNGREVKTRKLQLQATVKRFQFDLHLNLEGQHMLISSWFQR